MKKIRFFALLTALLLLCGCSGAGGNTEKTSGTRTQTNDKTEVTMENQEYPVHSLRIGGADISEYTIVYDRSANSLSVKKAASELQKYIEYACGKKLPTSSDMDITSRRIIVKASEEDTEGFSWKSDELGIVISGGKTRGALYGVYNFLEECIGMRFLSSDSEYCIESDSIDLCDLDRTYTQYFEFRDPYWTDYFDAEISAKRMVNSGLSRSFSDKLGSSFGFTGDFVHTFAALAEISQLEQPCLTDEKVYEKVLSNVMKLLRENPDAKIISVSQNDNANAYCRCPECARIDEEEGSHCGTLLRFVNRIAEAVEKEYPDVSIHTLAYQYTRKPPKITKPRKNVIIQLCTIECCFNHSLNDDSCELNRALKEDIIGWGKICDRIYIWDYVTNFRYYTMPFPNFKVIADNIRFFVQHNVKGLFEEGNYQGVSGEFGELRSYLLMLLMKNPYMTDDELDKAVDEFMAGYYGKGWKYIKEYYDFVNACGKAQNHFTIYADYEQTLGHNTFAANSDMLVKLFENALSLAENEKEREHIERTRVSCEVVRLTQLLDMTDENTPASVKAPLVEDNVRLHEIMKKYGIFCGEMRLVPDSVPADKRPASWA